MPSFVHLKSPTSSKFGEEYQLYLSDESNKDWFEWSFSDRYLVHKDSKNNSFSTTFENLESADKLIEKCKAAYEKSSTELKGTTEEDQKTKEGKDVWRYCSIFNEKPRTIEDNASVTDSKDKTALADGGDYKGKIGETKKSELVSTSDTSSSNAKFWELREEEFFGVDGKDGIGKYNTSTKTDASKKNIFDQLFDDKDTVAPLGKRIKDKCEEAYKETTSNDDGKVKDTDVVKYCGLKVQKQTTTGKSQ